MLGCSAGTHDLPSFATAAVCLCQCQLTSLSASTVGTIGAGSALAKSSCISCFGQQPLCPFMLGGEEISACLSACLHACMRDRVTASLWCSPVRTPL